MGAIEHAGYIVHDNEAIWGVGKTKDEALADFDMEAAASVIERNVTIQPATAALLSLVEAKGGGIAWGTHGGVACTLDEED
jgi:hypothetical protein